jgi:hypothetical protein
MPSQPRDSPGSRDIMFSFSVQTTTIAPVGNTGRPIDCKIIVGAKQTVATGQLTCNIQHPPFLNYAFLVSLSALGIDYKRDL